jgi:hypothetical protein
MDEITLLKRRRTNMKTLTRLMVTVVTGFAVLAGCNNGLSSGRESGASGGKRDRTQRTFIDNAKYVDFTVRENDARTVRREDLLYTLNKETYKNGNSSIKINAQEGTVEISSDCGFFNGKENCQVYGVFGLDVQAANEDCLYIKKNHKTGGFLIVDGEIFRDDAVPDLAVCLPLYGYSKNRIEVSPVMNGFIAMPSGTYWK